MNILYVCTGNIFRSMSAEYLTRKYITDNKIQNITVSSAGTIAHIEEPFPMTIKRLSLYPCDASPHHQRKITPEILGEQDLIICMAEHHRKSVNELGFEAVLFNEIAYNKTEDVLDDTEYMELYGADLDIDQYVISIVDYLHEAIPFVIKNREQKVILS